jgi:hypothetical protein
MKDGKKGTFLDRSLWIKLRDIEENIEVENYFFVVKEKTDESHWLGFKGTGSAVTLERVSEEFYLNFLKEKSEF